MQPKSSFLILIVRIHQCRRPKVFYTVVVWIKNFSQTSHVLKGGAFGRWLDHGSTKLISQLIHWFHIWMCYIRRQAWLEETGHCGYDLGGCSLVPGCFSLWLLPCSLLPGHQEVSNFASPQPSALIFLPQSQPIMDWNLRNHKLKQISSPLNCVSQVFLSVTKNLTNTHMEISPDVSHSRKHMQDLSTWKLRIIINKHLISLLKACY